MLAEHTPQERDLRGANALELANDDKAGKFFSTTKRYGRAHADPSAIKANRGPNYRFVTRPTLEASGCAILRFDPHYQAMQRRSALMRPSACPVLASKRTSATAAIWSSQRQSNSPTL